MLQPTALGWPWRLQDVQHPTPRQHQHVYLVLKVMYGRLGIEQNKNGIITGGAEATRLVGRGGGGGGGFFGLVLPRGRACLGSMLGHCCSGFTWAASAY